MENDKNIIIWIIAGILVLVLILGSYFGAGRYGMMGFGMGFGWMFMILYVGVLIWFFATPGNHCMTHTHHGGSDKDATDILKKRYAAGEISKKQYEEMKKELK